MRPETRWLVEESWRRLAPVREQAAELFFRRLAAGNAEDLTAFRGLDRREHRTLLLEYIDTVVRGLDRLARKPASAGPALGEGLSHDGGCLERIGEALIWTLQVSLKSKFTERAREAWTEALGRFAQTAATGPNPGPARDRPAA